MIRFLMALLVLHFSLFSLTSCTSLGPEEGEEGASTSGAIDDADIKGDGGAVTENGNDSSPGSGEEDVEAAMDQDEIAAEPAPKQKAEGAPEEDMTVQADDLEQDLNAESSPAPAPTPDEFASAAPVEETPQPPSSSVAVQTPPAETVEPAVPAAPDAAPEKAQIRDIRYMANSNGGTVIIESSKPVTYQTRMNPATQQFIIEIAEVELPANLQRPYTLKEFGSRFGSIIAYQSAGSSTARVVIQLSGAGTGEPLVQQEGTSLVVIPPSSPAPVAANPVPATPPGGISQTEDKPQRPLAARTLDEFLTGNQKFYGRPISLQVKDADVRDVVNFLAEESGANVVMSDDVSGKISLKVRKVPWDQALVTIMRTKSLGYVRQGNVLQISTLKTLQAETEIGNKILETQKNSMPAVVQVIPVSYAAMEELVKDVTPFLSKEGKAVADNRSSTLIVTDKAEVVERIARLVKTLDIPPAQVSIESKIVEATEDFQNFLGVNWQFGDVPKQISPSSGANGGPIYLTPHVSSGSLDKSITGALPFNAGLTVGSLDVFGNITAQLTLAEHDQLAKVISAPRISTMNREKSTILQQGENVSVVNTKSDTTGAVTSAEKRTPFSLELSVTPQITADGGVIMDLDVKREFLGAAVDNATQARPVNTRKAHTKVLVRNGQTAVIGGIYSSDETEATSGVPWLMNIPVLGWLFKNRSITRSKNELLIFMTPRILVNETTEQAANN